MEQLEVAIEKMQYCLEHTNEDLQLSRQEIRQILNILVAYYNVKLEQKCKANVN